MTKTMTRSPRPLRTGQCRVCTHKDRVRLEVLRIGGASLDALAREFGVSRDSVHRHFRNHVSPKRRAELMCGPAKVEQLANAAADESKTLLDYLKITRSILFNQFLAAAEAGDRLGVANVAGRLLDSLRELGKLTGELRQISGITVNNTSINLIASPEFLALQEGLLTIARAHPAVRADIVELLRGLDAKEDAARQLQPPRPNGAAHAVTIEGEAAHA
jgi:AcrR family transcriptional regulator